MYHNLAQGNTAITCDMFKIVLYCTICRGAAWVIFSWPVAFAMGNKPSMVVHPQHHKPENVKQILMAQQSHLANVAQD
jgi:hypothetical protein